MQLGAEEPDAFGTGVLQHWQIGHEAGIVEQRDHDAVAGDRRLVLELEIVRAALGPEPNLVDIGLLELAGRAQMHCAGRAIDDDVVAILGHRDDIFGLPNGHEAKGTGDNRHVSGGTALLEYNRA